MLVLRLLMPATSTGCASIQHYDKLEQPAGKALQAEIGTPLFRISRSSDLPKAFGKADLWGGKVDEGYVEIVFAGITAGGAIVLHVTDVRTRSTETTMSRYGTGSARSTSTTYGNTTTTQTVYVPPREGSTTILPPNTTEFVYDPRTGPLVIRGIEITVTSVAAYQLGYLLRDVRALQVDEAAER
jgi:hypothetical protein